MRRLSLRDFRGTELDPVGLDRQVNTVKYTQNMHFKAGSWRQYGGLTAVYGTPPVTPIWFIPFQTATDYYWLYFSSAKGYKVTGTTHTDITRTVGGDYSADLDNGWNGMVLGGVPIVNNGVDTPQMLLDIAGNLADLTNWNYTDQNGNTWTDNTCMTMRSYLNFAIALDVTKDDGVDPIRYPRMVKWSVPAEPGAVPTSWDETLTTNRAGEVNLDETQDYVIDCKPLRGTNIIYKQDTIWAMRFIGGNQVFDFDLLFSDKGILAQNCVADLDDGRHFVVTKNDIIVHDGANAQSIVDDVLRDYIFSNITAADYERTFVVPDYQNREILVMVPWGGTSYPSRGFAWSIDDGTWFPRDFGAEITWANYGIVDDTAQAGFIINDVTTIIDNDTSIIDGEQSYNPSINKIMMASTEPVLYVDGVGTLGVGGTELAYYILDEERALFPTENGPASDKNLDKHFDAIFPMMTGNGAVEVLLNVREHADGSYTQHGPYTFTLGQDKKIDVRASGKLWGYTIRSTNGANMTYHGIDFDMDVGGDRYL